MKILITTDLYNVSTNGVVTSVRNLMGELEAKGHDVRVLTFSENMGSHKDEKVYYIKSMPIGFIYPNMRMPVSYYNKLVNELIEWSPDVIHSQCEFFSYQFARRISRLTGAPIVHTYHTLYEDYVTYVIPSKWVGKRMVKQFSRLRLKKAKTVIAPTSKVDHTLRSYGLKNNIKVVPSGVSIKQHNYRMTEEERNAKRMVLGIPKDNHVLINLGRLGNEKNLEELMYYFASARKQNIPVTFLIVGDGPAKKGLEELAHQLGVEEHVIFTGMVPPTLVQEYYQLGDIFISASTSETQGLTYIEAAANGLALLCRKDDCLCDVVEEGVNGYQYKSEAEFLDYLQIMIAEPGWRKRAGERSVEIAQSFDKSRFGDTMETIYEAMIDTGCSA